MRPRRPILLLTALPFLAVYEAASLGIQTRVESDGAGLRRVLVTASADRQDALNSHLRKLDPNAPWVVRRQGLAGGQYQLDQDARFTRPDAFPGLTVERGTRFGLWPLAATTYTYTDKITRCDFGAQPKDQQAAAATEFDYQVTLPGVVDETSISPPGGKAEGHTVTWKLRADKDTLEVSARSAEPAWMFMVVVAYLLLVLLGSGLRLAVGLHRNRPRKI